MIIHEILQRENKLILTGEVYFPKRTNFQTLTPNYSVAQISNTSSGFDHSHAFAVVFDEEGNLLLGSQLADAGHVFFDFE